MIAGRALRRSAAGRHARDRTADQARPAANPRRPARRAGPRRRRVVGHPLRLAARPRPGPGSARPRGSRVAGVPAEHRAHQLGAWRRHCPRRGGRSRSRSGYAGSARPPGAARPRRGPRRRPRRPGTPARRPAAGQRRSASISASSSVVSVPYRSSRCSTTPTAIAVPAGQVGPVRATSPGSRRRRAAAARSVREPGHGTVAEPPDRPVDHVGGHHPVRGVLAAGHQHAARASARPRRARGTAPRSTRPRRTAAAAARRTRPRCPRGRSGRSSTSLTCSSR